MGLTFTSFEGIQRCAREREAVLGSSYTTSSHSSSSVPVVSAVMVYLNTNKWMEDTA